MYIYMYNMIYVYLSSMVLCYGKTLGQFTHPPPPGTAGLCEAVAPPVTETELKLQPFVSLGTSADLAMSGPEVLASHEGFAPAPIDTGGLSLPSTLNGIRDQLAHQLHEVWAKNKIEAGYTFAEVYTFSMKYIHVC